jgi:ParB/RepB/Spo0J family partition protein
MPDIGSFITATPKIVELAIDEVAPDPNQPRRHMDEDDLNALAKSIDALGQLVPILVAKDGDGWRIVAGERRWRAMKLLGKPMIAAIDYTYGNQEFIQLAENTARVELTPKEIMDVVDRLTAEGMSKAVIADTLGLSESTITRYRQILKSPDVAADVRSGELSVRDALGNIKKESAKSDDRGCHVTPLTPHGVGNLAPQSNDTSDTEITNQTGGDTRHPPTPQGVSSLAPQSKDIPDTPTDENEGAPSSRKELSPIRQQIVDYCETISHDLVYTTNSLALQYMVETLEQIVKSVS